jgi:hypothetical protein
VLAVAALTSCTASREKPRNEVEALMIRSDGREQLPRYVSENRADPALDSRLAEAGFTRSAGEAKDGCRYYDYHKTLDGMGQSRDAKVWLCKEDAGANLAYTFL